MAGQDFGVFRQSKKFCFDGVAHNIPGTARQIRSADRFHEQSIAAEDEAGSVQADAARRMPRRMNDFKPYIARGDGLPVFYQDIRGGRLRRAEHSQHGDGCRRKHYRVSFMHDDFRAGKLFHLGIAADMVNVSVRVDDVINAQFVLLRHMDDVFNIVRRIDNQRRPARVISRRLEHAKRRGASSSAERGARTGTKVRVANAVTDSAGSTHDLYLVMEVAQDPRFERKGDDLYTNIQIDLFTAVLGGEVSVPTFSGNVRLSIPNGTQPEQLFRLAGRGMPHLKNPTQHGDLFARVKVKIPRELTPHQRELFQQLART